VTDEDAFALDPPLVLGVLLEILLRLRLRLRVQ